MLAVFLFGCARKNHEYKSPNYYSLNNPYIIKLPSELDNISGITYYRKDNSLFAESDEKGCLYKILLNKPTDIRKWKFSHKRDYEDIVLHDSVFYILNNNGDIVTLSLMNDSLASHEYTFPENGKYEFESLYYDDTLHKLVLMCKDCDIDKKNTVSTYSFDTQQFTYSSACVIDAKNLPETNTPTSVRFKPSAASINPVTGELYILSSANKLLVIAERSGKVKNVYHLDPELFNQPEGIAFTPNGGMFISNEAGTGEPATILFYQYKKDNK
ncbi:MAG: SdiA-regulated domain-containing protein [Taibaiella sp.]|nr:SdiA-regulated domain-containing protein [Taibaiella sp.]